MTLNTRKQFPVIYSGDTAIDTAKMSESEMLAYLHERDISKLPRKSGERASVFHLRAISHERLADILDTCATDAARQIRAFRASVIRVDDCRFDDGKRGSWVPADVDMGMSPDEARLFPMALIVDIGSVAWTRSFLGEGSAPRYVPPPLLLAHLAALPYRSAAPSDAGTSKPKDSATQASADPVEVLPAELYGSPTVAPATAEQSHPAA